ncbi:MAG: CBS domain-containing protein [Gammaproteobacteria bacterium]
MQILPERVTLDDPAINVLTDLAKVTAVTIGPTATLKDANAKMINNRVRLLLVIDSENTVLGLITATDILGEKPMRYMQMVNARSPDEVLVRDIMTPRQTLEVIQMVDVEKATVGDVVASLRREGRQHALVVDIDEDSMNQMIRGIFSASQIGRQLGIKIETAEIAKTFAELEAALSV